MSSACKISLILFLFILLKSPAAAGEKNSDKWFGKDKFEHLGYSAFLAGGTCLVAHRHFHNGRDNSLFIGVGVTVTLGSAKEAVDYKRSGRTAGGKDLIWDIAGSLAGAFAVFLAL